MVRLECAAARQPQCVVGWLPSEQVCLQSARHLQECVLAHRDLPRSRYFLAIELRANAVVLGNAGFEWSGADGESREGRLGYFLEP